MIEAEVKNVTQTLNDIDSFVWVWIITKFELQSVHHNGGNLWTSCKGQAAGGMGVETSEDNETGRWGNCCD